MNPKQIRGSSLEKATAIGLEISSVLPLLDTNLKIRNIEEVISRMLIIHTLAAVAYGFGKEKAVEWLRHESVFPLLTAQESLFLKSGKNPEQFKLQVEGLWALAWAMGIIKKDLDFTKDCDEDFVTLLPNLKIESATDFRKKVNPRPLLEVLGALDLSYCLHWAVRQSILSGHPCTELKDSVVVERRKALEWLLHKGDWDKITLDT